MKNPVNLELLWSAMLAKQTMNLVKSQAKLEKANRNAAAAWLKGMQDSGALAFPSVFTNPAAVLAAAA
jgi:hypothetical protein